MPTYCITADYTPEAVTAMRNNPNTNRREAVGQLLEAAGAKLVAFYGRTENGPGVLCIFECDDPNMALAFVSVTSSSGAATNVHLQRLVTQDDIITIRENAKKLVGAYKPPGQ